MVKMLLSSLEMASIGIEGLLGALIMHGTGTGTLISLTSGGTAAHPDKIYE